MIREIAQIGNPILRKTVPEITDDSVLEKLKKDLTDTLADQSRGVAIAAPQIFEKYRAFLINIQPTDTRKDADSFGPVVMINPVIEKEFGDEKAMFEGCLSIAKADLFGEVKRKSQVKIKYFDLKGREFNEEYGGFIARVIQHEYDHLNGILFTDKVNPKTLMSGDEYSKFQNRK